MKSLIAIFALMFGIATMSNAQTAPAPRWETTEADVDLKEGQNTVRMPDGSRVQCMFRAGEVSNVVVIDKAGKRVVMNDNDDSTAGNPGTPKPCNGIQRCVFNTKYQTYICFCLPGSISIGQPNDPTAQIREHILLARQVGVPQ